MPRACLAIAGLWPLIAAVASGQTPGSAFVGAKQCANCHPAQFARQSASAHAQALYPVAQHPLALSFPADRTMLRKPGYEFRFAFRPPDFHVVIGDGKDVMDLPLQWAFGSGRQAVTFVSHVDKDWYVEHFATYYTAIHDYGPTPGQGDLKPDSLPRAAGVLYKIADRDNGIAGCFECHSTGPVTFDSGGSVNLTESGVHCESCHGAGSAHAKKPIVGMRNPRKISAVALNTFCGSCHRPPASDGKKIDWNYAWNVRHQPIYLNESRCFQKSNGALSCLTCHDPHEAAATRSLAAYSRECQQCHKPDAHPPKASCLAAGPDKCVDCHMPLVSPQPPLRFTNHWIGVYRGGAKLKPVR